MKKLGIALTFVATSLFATAAVSAQDNGGGGPTLSDKECEELWEAYHTLGNALNDLAGKCSAPFAVDWLALCFDQNSALPGVRGNGITSRTLERPVT